MSSANGYDYLAGYLATFLFRALGATASEPAHANVTGVDGFIGSTLVDRLVAEPRAVGPLVLLKRHRATMIPSRADP